MFETDCIVSFVCVTCLKFLFIPLYKSTDFEVHRNWMAITYEKPIKEWYFEKTSEWTLDYPPFFAWFELLLAHVAKYFDPEMLKVENVNYSSFQTVFFLRLSVILSDVVYFYGVSRLYGLAKSGTRKVEDPWIRKEVVLSMLLLWNPGLLMVDHIHFQYNGFLTGILFISVACMFEEEYVCSAMWFSVLLNLKHIYLYMAPAYFLYLLKNYCLRKTASGYTICVSNFSKLAAVCLSTVLLSLGPFIYMGQLRQVLSRLFPVKRGLTHSYWAPNVWALYNFTDRFLSFMASYFGLSGGGGSVGTCITKGVVQECSFGVLPNVSAGATLALAAASFFPVMWLIWKNPANPKVFLSGIILCSFGSFIFGYHVHEKAILMIILPLTFSAVLLKEHACVLLFLSTVGHFSLFPLLYEEGETVLKIGLLLLHTVYTASSLGQLHRFKEESLLTAPEKVYLSGLAVLQMFYSFGSRLMDAEQKYAFLPLLLISTYCTLGVLYAWLRYLKITLWESDSKYHRDVTTKKVK